VPNEEFVQVSGDFILALQDAELEECLDSLPLISVLAREENFDKL